MLMGRRVDNRRVAANTIRLGRMMTGVNKGGHAALSSTAMEKHDEIFIRAQS